MADNILNWRNRLIEKYILKHKEGYLGHPDDGLSYLRNRFFINILLFSFPVCIFVYIPSIIVSLTTDALAVAAGDTIAMLIISVIFFGVDLPLRFRKQLFSGTLYLLSLLILFLLGTKGPGTFILLCSNVLIILYYSKRAGFIFFGLNSVILLLYLAISPLDGNHIRFFQQYTFVAWVGVGFNLIAFNFITILGVITLVEHLNRYFLKEQKLQMELKKEKEDLMVARARAEESDRLKTAFLANMSHEIRTPMNGILGFAGLLRDPELEPDEQERYLSIIKRSGERMLNILNNIIDISKIEAGISTLSVTPVYVIEVMRQVELLFIPLAQEKRLKLTFYQGLSDTESNILTDEEKLFSILANLVKNAIQFSDTGEITVTCKLRTELQPHENSALKFLDFLVKDQGICIPEDRQEAIFERFITADIANRQARAGAGLGLALVKAYIEMLHGQISVESTPGAGTVFRFSIPVLPNNVTNNISA